jgi:D-hydroxyproline dehydrogenase subunit beta
MSRRPDVVVVGAGVVGAAVAYYLSVEGLRVEVHEAGFAGGGTTASGMGHIMVMGGSEPEFALTSYSAALLDELVPELDAACEVDVCGALWLAEDDAQLELVHAKHAWFAARGFATDVLDDRAVADAEPQLRQGLAGALRMPADAVVYPPALAAWLLARAAEHGCRLREGERVAHIEPHAVIGTSGTTMTGIVVNAAGAAAPALTPGLPIEPRKGHLVVTDRYPGFLRHQLLELGYLTSAHTMSSASVALNVQPRLTGQLLIGSSRELVGWRRGINRAIVQRMLARAVAFLPGLGALSAIRTWTGFRPATADNLPLIGSHDVGAGTWIAAGHEGLGITTALGTGRMLADMIVGRAPAIDPAPYDATRAVAAQTTNVTSTAE